MGLEERFSDVDRRRIKEVLERVSAEQTVVPTVSSLLEEWRALVELISGGGEWNLAGFNRGLRVRNLLEEISESLSMEGRQLLAGALAKPDGDFIEATYDPLHPDSRESPQSEIGWWQFRIPKDSQGRLDLSMPES